MLASLGYMGSSLNQGPFLGVLFIRILGASKGALISRAMVRGLGLLACRYSVWSRRGQFG